LVFSSLFFFHLKSLSCASSLPLYL
jgi:hypothetical protein